MKRRAFFGLFTAAPAVVALPAVVPDSVRPDDAAMKYARRVLAATPMPAGLSVKARAQHREHIVRAALTRLHEEQVRLIAAL